MRNLYFFVCIIFIRQLSIIQCIKIHEILISDRSKQDLIWFKKMFDLKYFQYIFINLVSAETKLEVIRFIMNIENIIHVEKNLKFFDDKIDHRYLSNVLFRSELDKNNRWKLNVFLMWVKIFCSTKINTFLIQIINIVFQK